MDSRARPQDLNSFANSVITFSDLILVTNSYIDNCCKWKKWIKNMQVIMAK